MNELHDARHAFLQTKERLPTLFAQHALTPKEFVTAERYVVGLECRMRGNLDYSLSSTRYWEIELSIPGQRSSWIDNIVAVPAEALIAPVSSLQ